MVAHGLHFEQVAGFKVGGEDETAVGELVGALFGQ